MLSELLPACLERTAAIRFLQEDIQRTIKKPSTRGPGAVPSIEANGDRIRRNGQAQPGRGRPDTNSSDFDLSRRQRLASFFRPVSNGFHSPITSLHHLFREAVVQCDAIAPPFERAGD